MNYNTQARNQASLIFSLKFWLLTLLLLLIYSAAIFAQNIVYIDPTNSGDPGQNGSVDHPYDQWTDFSIANNTTYLQKRGTTYNGPIQISDKHHVTIGAYGTGDRPQINGQGSGNVVHVLGSNNVLVKDLEIYNPNYQGSGVRLQATASDDVWDVVIRNCKIHHTSNGIRAVSNAGDWIIYDIKIVSCEIYDIEEDGIFGNYEHTFVCDSNYIYKVNMGWHTIPGGHSQTVSGGDGIQIGYPDVYYLRHNVIDRRYTGNKFCFILGTSSDYTIGYIEDNIFYPPKDTTDDNGGCALYIFDSEEVYVRRNKFIGRADEFGNRGIAACQLHSYYETEFSYNLIDSLRDIQFTNKLEKLEFYNNTVVAPFNEDVYMGTQDGNNYIYNNVMGNAGFNTTGVADSSNNYICDANNYNAFNNYFGFIDSQNGNFALSSGAGVIDKGSDIGLPMDIVCTPVPQGLSPDAGAYEFMDGTSTNAPPQIANQSFSVQENSSNGSVVGTVVASDPDPDQTLTFSIISGNTGNAFQINSSSGVLSVNNASALNFEANPAFNLTIKVQDNGPGSLSDQATVTVNLLDVNETPNINNQSFSVQENTANGQNVGTVVATDPDNGQSLTFSILSGNTSNAFQIGASSGTISVNNTSALNFEVTPVFNLVIKVQDNGSGNLSDQATITINLTDQNETPNIDNQSFTVQENSPNGQTVGTVVASDPDNGQNLAFSILSGNTGNAFTINSSSGVLSVGSTSALNFEVTPIFNLVIKVQDNGAGSLSDQATVTVNLTDQNESPNIGNQSFTVQENSPNGQSVGTVIASDPDSGQSLTYSIVSGNTNSAFQINSTSGLLSVNNTGALNFEAIPTFSLVIKVEDNGAGNLSNQATVVVSLLDVNEPPQINDQVFVVAAWSPNGTQVGTVLASDPDIGQFLTFTIESGNINSAFEIDESSGELTVNNADALNGSIPSFLLVVTVTDNGIGNLTDQADITIEVTENNQPPQISNQVFDIDENSAAGTVVGTVVASDPDPDQTLTFTLISGNTGNAFQINSNTGVLTVNNASALNYENIEVFNLVVKVQDNGLGTLSAQATVTVSVNDINETPDVNDQSFAVAEWSPNGTFVGTVLASDPDNGQTLTYSIESGNTNAAFQIDAGSGELTVNNSNALNGSIPTFVLEVKVTDNGTGNLSDQADITIGVTDNNQPPQISNQSFDIDENSTAGTVVGTVVASDPDPDQTLTFTLVSGNTGNAFQINSNTGVLTVSNASALNYENIEEFNLVVKVQDDGLGTLSAQATVNVSVNDLNEAPEIDNQQFSIEEYSPNGSEVGTVEATDPDNGQLLSFSIVSGNVDNAFQINASTGMIVVANSSALQAQVNPVFNLVVKVQDNGQGSLSSQANVDIYLLETNQAPNIVDQIFEIEENSVSGELVGQVIAWDPDAGQTITYSIVSGNTDNAFMLDDETGELFVNNGGTINFEEYPVFELVVEVQDNGPGALTANATVTVDLLDVNEPPTLEPQVISNYLSHSTFAGELTNILETGIPVGIVIAEEPDAGQTLDFEILPVWDYELFSIDPVSGELTLVNPYILKPQGMNNMKIRVKVTENNTSQQYFDMATVQVKITIDGDFLISILGINDLELNHNGKDIHCNLYPNPAFTDINLNLDNLEKGTVVVFLHDMRGTLIRKIELNNENPQFSSDFDVSTLQNGIYFITILNGDRIVKEKFVKM